MNPALPQTVLWLLDVFKTHKKEIYLVGGCVRDMLLERTIHDYDFTTNATPAEMMAFLKEEDCRVIPTGIQHGTLTILKEDQEMEVTTYRQDGNYLQHRKPDHVSFTSSLYEDLARRDFTINAMAYHPEHGLIDPFSGQKDLQEKRLQTVHDPQVRFQEDALRILRGIRFSLTLEFNLTQECIQAIQENAHLLSFISFERIRDEFNKMLQSDAQNILTLLREMKVLPYIIPEFEMLYNIPQETKWHIYDVFTHTDQALNATKGYCLSEKLAIVLHDFGKADTKWIDECGCCHFHGHPAVSVNYAQTILKRLKYANKVLEEVKTLIFYHDYYVQPNRRILRRFLSHIDMNYALAYAILRVQYADDQAKNMEYVQEKLEIIDAAVALLTVMETEKDGLQLKDMAVNGHDMIALGYEGKQIKEILQILYDIIISDPARNQHDELMEFAREYKIKINCSARE